MQKAVIAAGLVALCFVVLLVGAIVRSPLPPEPTKGIGPGTGITFTREGGKIRIVPPASLYDVDRSKKGDRLDRKAPPRDLESRYS